VGQHPTSNFESLEFRALNGIFPSGFYLIKAKDDFYLIKHNPKSVRTSTEFMPRQAEFTYNEASVAILSS
jgi:hypothetical protein